LLRRKVLSSAVTKGIVGDKSSHEAIVDAARKESAGFWRGYRLRLLDDRGLTVGESLVVDFRAGAELRVSPLFAERHGVRSLQYELISPEEAPLLALRLFFGLRLEEPIPPCVVLLGTTRGTNALLTRRGAKTALITTRGFADILHIGYQNRPKLFELAIKKPAPLFSAVAEIDERIAADGSVLQAPSDTQIYEELARLKTTGIESLAICLLNSYANPLHEEQVDQLARAAGFSEISVSSRVSPLM